MKKLIITHLFLNLYILVIVQPILPIVDYLVNYNYIVNELCENRDKPVLACNGKCYLEKQVKQQLNLRINKEIPKPPKVNYEKILSIKNVLDNFVFIGVIQNQASPLFYNDLKGINLLISIFRPPII